MMLWVLGNFQWRLVQMYHHRLTLHIPWGSDNSSQTMHSTPPLGWRSSPLLPHRCLLQQNWDQASRLCSSCAKLPQSQHHCIGDLNKITDFNFFYVMAIQKVGLMVKYKSLVTGSVVALKPQATNSSNSAWSEKVGAWALLYFWHLSRHVMPSVSIISNRILAL